LCRLRGASWGYACVWGYGVNCVGGGGRDIPGGGGWYWGSGLGFLGPSICFSANKPFACNISWDPPSPFGLRRASPIVGLPGISPEGF
jgi:hypothetical protein